MKSKRAKDRVPSSEQRPNQAGIDHGRIVSIPDRGQCLDSLQLGRLEQSFREWAENSPRADVRLSRRRILIIFLLIRYTGAKLSEVLALNPFEDIDPERRSVRFHGGGSAAEFQPREVQISRALASEIQAALADPVFRGSLISHFNVDPGFVRRKFYERAETGGLTRGLAGPEMIRRARAVELMQGNMPLPAVQVMLGHSTPGLTSSYVVFSEDEIEQVTRLYLEREASRKTSARNAFFGKIRTIRRGDIQAWVKLATMSGESVATIITNDSLDRLFLREGSLVTAEVKAPWVILESTDARPVSSAENIFHGVITRIARSEVSVEYAVSIPDGTELCAVVSEEGSRQLGVCEGDRVWVLFSAFAVVLHID